MTPVSERSSKRLGSTSRSRWILAGLSLGMIPTSSSACQSWANRALESSRSIYRANFSSLGPSCCSGKCASGFWTDGRRQLGSGDLGAMEAMELEQILAAYSRVSSANKAMFAKLRVVLQQFHSNGIDCILLKGSDLIPRLYGVLGLRGMVDVNLLVHESDLPAIDHLLTQLGYRPQLDGNPSYVDPNNMLALVMIT